MPKSDAERGVLQMRLPCLRRVPHPAAVLSPLTSGQLNSPKPCRMADRERRVLRLNLMEALSGLTRLNRAAGLPACASDSPREDFVCLICPCTMKTLELRLNPEENLSGLTRLDGGRLPA